MLKFKKAFYMLFELLLRFSINPRIRARLLRIAGASIGDNVRIYESRFINLESGFKNLKIDDNVFIGEECIFDLAGEIMIKKGVTISMAVKLITHTNPGSIQNSPLCDVIPPSTGKITIANHCWIGTNSVILPDVYINSCVVVGACSLVNKDLNARCLYAGSPAKLIRKLEGLNTIT
jgi:acetyltransferase-like isoleucine patch superfamily enzyme